VQGCSNRLLRRQVCPDLSRLPRATMFVWDGIKVLIVVDDVATSSIFLGTGGLGVMLEPGSSR
jgi:hypothetical protein